MLNPSAPPPLAPDVDEASLRAALGRFATGVALVTADAGGAPLGLIVSSFASVSLRPPLISFCPSRDSLTWRRMRAAGVVAVNVLAREHAEFAARAAAPAADRFAGLALRRGDGPPILRDAVATLECEIEAEHPAGDHSIVVGRIRAVHVRPGARPLVYWASEFGGFER